MHCGSVAPPRSLRLCCRSLCAPEGALREAHYRCWAGRAVRQRRPRKLLRTDRKTMVTVRLQGGLGNQMFQYAVGRSLAHQHGTSVALDISSYRHDKLREYALGVFRTTAQFEEYPRLTRTRSWGQRLRLPGFGFELGAVRVPGFTYVLREKSFAFDPGVLEAPDNVYLDGFWQTEKYFSAIAEIIRHELCLKEDPSDRNAEMASEIRNKNAV